MHACMQTSADGRLLSSKGSPEGATSSGASDTITHAAPTHPDTVSVAHSARSAAALPGSPRSDPSSSLNGTIGAATGPRAAHGHVGASSQVSESTAGLSGTGATLRAVPEGSHGCGSGSMGASPGAGGSGVQESGSTRGWGGGAESAAVVSDGSGSGWSPAGGVAGGPGDEWAAPSYLGATRGTVLSALSFGDTTEMRTFIDATRTGAPPMRELEVSSPAPPALLAPLNGRPCSVFGMHAALARAS